MSIAPSPVGVPSRWQRLFMTAAALSAAQFLWLIAMGFIAGGQFVEDEWPQWDPLAPWPVIAVPAWLSIALAVLATIGAVGMATQPIRDPREGGGAIQAIAITIIALVAVPIALANVYADPSGIQLPLFWLDDPLGWHWLAAPPQIITLVALGIRLARARRAGRAA